MPSLSTSTLPAHMEIKPATEGLTFADLAAVDPFLSSDVTVDASEGEHPQTGKARHCTEMQLSVHGQDNASAEAKRAIADGAQL